MRLICSDDHHEERHQHDGAQVHRHHREPDRGGVVLVEGRRPVKHCRFGDIGGQNPGNAARATSRMAPKTGVSHKLMRCALLFIFTSPTSRSASGSPASRSAPATGQCLD